MTIDDKDSNTNDIVRVSITINNNQYYNLAYCVNTLQDLESVRIDTIATVKRMKCKYFKGYEDKQLIKH